MLDIHRTVKPRPPINRLENKPLSIRLPLPAALGSGGAEFVLLFEFHSLEQTGVTGVGAQRLKGRIPLQGNLKIALIDGLFKPREGLVLVVQPDVDHRDRERRKRGAPGLPEKGLQDAVGVRFPPAFSVRVAEQGGTPRASHQFSGQLQLVDSFLAGALQCVGHTQALVGQPEIRIQIECRLELPDGFRVAPITE